MVEHTIKLDYIFSSLADPIRRDILIQVSDGEYSVGELVSKYHVSFAAISKHLKVLERANLISKRKEGKKQMVSLAPEALKAAAEYLEQYRKIWQVRYGKLDDLLN